MDDPNGYFIIFLTVAGATQGDSMFAVPGASGCGGALLSPVVGPAINLNEGRSSPATASNNDLVLDEATSSIALSPLGQIVLGEAWKASCLAEC